MWLDLQFIYRQLLKKTRLGKKVFLSLLGGTAWTHLQPWIICGVWKQSCFVHLGSRVLSDQTAKYNTLESMRRFPGQRYGVLFNTAAPNLTFRAKNAKKLGSSLGCPRITDHRPHQFFCSILESAKQSREFQPIPAPRPPCKCYNSWNSKDHHLSDLIWSHSMINKFNKITNWQTVCNKCYFLDNKMDNVHSATYARNYWKQM